MYKLIIRPVLFLFSPEAIHHFVISVLRFFLRPAFIRKLVHTYYLETGPGLRRELFGLSFKNPVGLAAGFDKDALVFNELASFGFSFIEIGTITPVGQPGNPRPRSFRLFRDKGLINRMGFNNQGVEAAVARLKKRNADIILGGNIGKNTLTPNEKAQDDYAACFEGLYDYVDYLVINVSCPNISSLSELQDREELLAIVGRIVQLRSRKASRKPILIKISPDLNTDQIDDVLGIAGDHDIDGIIATNTSIRRDGLNTPDERIREIGSGGLSGVPIQKRATEVIRYIHRKTSGKLPIIGVGGIMTAEDALEKIEAGASLVQVYTGFIYEGPGIVRRINRALSGFNKLS